MHQNRPFLVRCQNGGLLMSGFLGELAAFAFLVIIAILVWNFVTSKPVTVIALSALGVTIGSMFVMFCGFFAARIIITLFAIQEPQAVIGIGVVGSICASLLCIAIVGALAGSDINDRLEEINKALGGFESSNSGACDLSEEQKIQMLEQFALHGRAKAIKYVRSITNCSFTEAEATLNASIKAPL
jgi:hypothetical protein